MALIVREPRWIQPVFARPGDRFRVVVEGAGNDPVEFELRKAGEVYPLESNLRTRVEADRFLVLECALPRETPAGLYDLRARAHRETATMPKAVCARKDFSLPFTFAHTTDLHLIKGGADGALYDRRGALERVVDEINAAAPAFVMNTGDAISRYGRSSPDLLSPQTVDWQFREARRILLRLRSPLFLIAGNHDRAFSWCRRAWDRTVGRPWDREWDDYRFDYGECAFFCLDGTVLYDDTDARAVAAGYSAPRLDWLGRELRAASGKRFRLLCHHYDYGRKLLAVAQAGGVDMMLFGHSKRNAYGAGDSPPFSMSHLAAHEAWRPIAVSAEGLALGPARTFAQIGGTRPFEAGIEQEELEIRDPS